MSALGQLVVSLIAETSQFRAAMEKSAYTAQKTFNSIQRNAQTMLAGLGVYLSADLFIGWVKGAIDAADALNDLSERTGVATDALSKLQYAAKISDVSTEEFSSNLIKFNRSIAETARGTGEAKKAFDAMGIAVTTSSGELRDTESVLRDVADRFATYADGANKTALATALFGRSGATFITFLNNGSAGLARFGEELEQLGGVIMPQAARKAAELNDMLDRMRAATGAAGTEIGVSLAPYLTQLISQFLILTKQTEGFGQVFTTAFALGFRSFNLQEALRGVREELEQVNQYTSQSTINSLKRQEAVLREAIQTEALSRATGDLSDQLSRRLAVEERIRQEQQKKKPAPALMEDKKSTGNQADEAAKLIERQALAVQKLTLSEEELAVAEVFLAGASVQQLESSQRLADALTRQRTIQEDLKRQTDAALELYREYKQLYDETASPAQKLADEEARLLALRERLIENGYDLAAVENLIAEARMNAADRAIPRDLPNQLAELQDVARQFSSAIGTAFEDAILRGDDLRGVLKGLEQDILRIAMRTLVTKPLEGAIQNMLTAAVPGSGGISSFFPSIFGGARASGGPVVPSQAYLVGEKGPELFVPNASSGTIVPNLAKQLKGAIESASKPSPGSMLPGFERQLRSSLQRAVEPMRQAADRLSGIDFAGARAGGGLVVPGQAYLVGEKGPELFAPNRSAGTIVPNERIGSSTVININVSGVTNGDEIRRSAAQVASAAAVAVQRGRRNL